MRMALLCVVAGSLLAGTGVPAHATDQKGFEEQARVWCDWMGAAQAQNGAEARPWALGCPASQPNEGLTSPEKGPEGRLFQDRAHLPIGKRSEEMIGSPRPPSSAR